MRKPNPLQNFFKGIKMTTVGCSWVITVIGLIFGWLMVTSGNVTPGMLVFAIAGLSHIMGRSLYITIQEEERRAKYEDDEDEGS